MVISRRKKEEGRRKKEEKFSYLGEKEECLYICKLAEDNRWIKMALLIKQVLISRIG
ncbi:hypothetical protein [Phormidium nigroviride]